MNRIESREIFKGSIPALRPSFLRDGSLDYRGIEHQIERIIGNRAKVLMLTPGDSHFFCLSNRELAKITHLTCRVAAGRIKVVAADHHYTTRRSLEFAEYARAQGADFVMPFPPDWGASVTADLVVDHLELASRVLPVVFITALAARSDDFHLEVAEKLAERTERFVAIKDDRPGRFGQRLCLSLGDKVAVFAGGQKLNHMNIHPFGATGYFSLGATFFPDLARNYWEAIERDDLNTALGVIRKTDHPLFTHLLSYPGGFDAAIHGLLEICGIAERWRPSPYYSLNDGEMERLRTYVADAALL